MEKKDQRTRTITLFSKKNNEIRTVRSKSAKKVATYLEKETDVTHYDSNVEMNLIEGEISSIGIRPSYMKESWITDFVVNMRDGSTMIIEVADAVELQKKSIIERLEISRRYWQQNRVNKWIIAEVKKEKGETSW